MPAMHQVVAGSTALSETMLEDWTFELVVLAQGNINIIDAAVKKGCKKFILVTSIGTGDSKDAPPKQVLSMLLTLPLCHGTLDDTCPASMTAGACTACTELLLPHLGASESTGHNVNTCLICGMTKLSQDGCDF